MSSSCVAEAVTSSTGLYIKKWWPLATEMATAFMLQAASAWRDCEIEVEAMRFYRLYRIPWINCRLQISSYMLSCSCVERVCKMAGVCLCSFIGPYKVQGSRETHIQWGWLLASLSQFYMSDSVSSVSIPDFTLLFVRVKQGGSWAA